MRYEIWSFSQPKTMYLFAKDNDCDTDTFRCLMQHNVYNRLIPYGNKEFSCETEDMALKCAFDIACRTNMCEIFIWDNEEKIWLE